MSFAPAHAGVPEPDTVLFGSIALDSRAITAADADVSVELRATATGAVLSEYRMGSKASAGDFYVLRVKSESVAPVLEADAVPLGATVYLTIRDASGVRNQRTHTLTTRGQFARLDFGAVSEDSDNDGLPDVWELARFGHLGQGANGDLDGDGRSNAQEHLAGTNPNDPSDIFRLTMTEAGVNKVVSFLARRAEGPGYEGFSRFYGIEYTTNVGTGPWLGIAGQTNLLGNNSIITYQTREAGAATFYRGRLTLQRP